MTESPWRDKKKLKRLYINESLSSIEIADDLGCSCTTILNWLDKFSIEKRKPAWERPVPLMHN